MRRRPNDDPLTRLARAEEDIRKLKLAVFGTVIGGGGGGGGFVPYAAKVQAYNSSSSLAAGSNNPITFNSVIFDSTGSIWDGGSGLVAPVDGLYAFAGAAVFDGVPSGYQDLSLYVRDPTGGGGGGVGPLFAEDRVDEPPSYSGGQTWGIVAGYADLSAGQKIGLLVENGGGTLVTTHAGAGGGEQVFSGGPVFGMHLVS